MTASHDATASPVETARARQRSAGERRLDRVLALATRIAAGSVWAVLALMTLTILYVSPLPQAIREQVAAAADAISSADRVRAVPQRQRRFACINIVRNSLATVRIRLLHSVDSVYGARTNGYSPTIAAPYRPRHRGSRTPR